MYINYYESRKKAELKELIGKTLISATASVGGNDLDEVRFTTTDGKVYLLFHDQCCCENVDIESIVGDLNDLVGEPMLVAEEVTSENKDPDGYVYPDRNRDDSFTWTFYKFATRKGYVDIRWYGESNGYYSESVDFAESLGERDET
jgi:hypothetical protein